MTNNDEWGGYLQQQHLSWPPVKPTFKLLGCVAAISFLFFKVANYFNNSEISESTDIACRNLGDLLQGVSIFSQLAFSYALSNTKPENNGTSNQNPEDNEGSASQLLREIQIDYKTQMRINTNSSIDALGQESLMLSNGKWVWVYEALCTNAQHNERCAEFRIRENANWTLNFQQTIPEEVIDGKEVLFSQKFSHPCLAEVKGKSYFTFSFEGIAIDKNTGSYLPTNLNKAFFQPYTIDGIEPLKLTVLKSDYYSVNEAQNTVFSALESYWVSVNTGFRCQPYTTYSKALPTDTDFCQQGMEPYSYVELIDSKSGNNLTVSLNNTYIHLIANDASQRLFTNSVNVIDKAQTSFLVTWAQGNLVYNNEDKQGPFFTKLFWNVYARRCFLRGNPHGVDHIDCTPLPIKINSEPSNQVTIPRIAGIGSDNYAVIWDHFSELFEYSYPKLQFVDQYDSLSSNNDIQVAPVEPGNHISITTVGIVANIKQKMVTVVWNGYSPDDQEGCPLEQSFYFNGTKVFNDDANIYKYGRRVSTDTNGKQVDTQIEMLENGDRVISWSTRDKGIISAQRINSRGEKIDFDGEADTSPEKNHTDSHMPTWEQATIGVGAGVGVIAVVGTLAYCGIFRCKRQDFKSFSDQIGDYEDLESKKCLMNTMSS